MGEEGGTEGRGREGRKEKPHFGSSMWDLTFQSTIKSFGHLSTLLQVTVLHSDFVNKTVWTIHSFGTTSSAILLVKESL